MNEHMKAGFTYMVEVLDPNGVVLESEVVTNLMPDEGITHMLNVTLKGGAQVTNWFVGLYEGNYVPTGDETAATMPVDCTETTAYTPGTRPAFVAGAIAAGNVDNSASKAEFTFTANKTVYGGFISSASAKGSTSGVILSAVRFGSPKSLEAGNTLRVTAGFTLVSA